jgi:TolA-binding protein
MKKIVKLTESDLRKMIGNIVSEQSTMDMSEQSNPQDEIKRLNIEIEKLKKQLAANQMELKKRANLDQRVQQLAKGPKKSMEEQSKFPKTEKHQLWDLYLQTFGPSSKKHIKMKDGDYSLNWGSHSGSGYDWGMSIAKRGTFAFQTTNKEKKAIVEGLIKQYSIPFRASDYEGNYSIHSIGTKSIYDVDENNMIGFLKKILGNFR